MTILRNPKNRQIISTRKPVLERGWVQAEDGSYLCKITSSKTVRISFYRHTPEIALELLTDRGWALLNEIQYVTNSNCDSAAETIEVLMRYAAVLYAEADLERLYADSLMAEDINSKFLATRRRHYAEGVDRSRLR